MLSVAVPLGRPYSVFFRATAHSTHRMASHDLSTKAGKRARADYIPPLDGLRFMAAFLVVGGHYASLVGPGFVTATLVSLTGLGMTLFFVLSGFVIHYNYSATIPRPGGLRAFFVARFARLYPLYIVLFLLEFVYGFLTGRSACGHLGDATGQFMGLFYYLTMTQSWIYGIICNSSLTYQYGPISAVTWSISVEMFFYLVYCGIAVLVARYNASPRGLVGLAAIAYGLVVAYLFLCGHFQPQIDSSGATLFGSVASTAAGYNDSLLRWLFYFNPVARLPEFLAGMAAAHLYIAHRRTGAEKGSGSANLMTLAAVGTVLAVHLWLYMAVTPSNSFIGRIASPLYGPLVAIMMYLTVRYATAWSRLLSSSILVRLGEASYSIYLLHEILPSAAKRLHIVVTSPLSGWILWVVTLLILMIVSRLSYLWFEHPARVAIRRLLASKSIQHVRYV